MKMNKALVNVDLDFFTKPQFIGNYYQEKKWSSKSNFKAQARKWLHTNEFINSLPLENNYIRGCIVKEDNQPLFYWNNLIQTKWFEPQNFDIIHFDAHHDMYKWHHDDYYIDKNGLSNYHPFESLIAPLQMKWTNNIIWVHPDYITPNIPDFNKIYPKNNIKTIQWSDWNWNNHSLNYLSIVTNPDMSIINEGMINDFKKIIQEW